MLYIYHKYNSLRQILLILFALGNICICKAQYKEIPLRLDTCLRCHGTGINPNYCRVCHGTGLNKAWSERTRDFTSYHCMACAGGLPYKCYNCTNGVANVTTNVINDLKLYIPLWSLLDMVEDVFFIGNAKINDRYIIKNHKIQSFYDGSIELQNRRYISISYNNDNNNLCSVIINGMIGMYDYEKHYDLIGTHLALDSIKTLYIHEPHIQRYFSHNDSIVGEKHNWSAKYINDSTLVADDKYIITQNYIKCCHNKYFFENGIIVRKISYGKECVYKYLEFDTNNNWIQRDVLDKNNNIIRKETRKIQYF